MGQESKPVGQERARLELTNPLPPRAFLNGRREPRGGPAGGWHLGTGCALGSWLVLAGGSPGAGGSLCSVALRNALFSGQDGFRKLVLVLCSSTVRESCSGAGWSRSGGSWSLALEQSVPLDASQDVFRC